jgi:hypothetical protein
MAVDSRNLQYSLTVQTDYSRKEIQKLEASLMRIIGYINMITPGNSSVRTLTVLAQDAIVTFRSLQLAIRAVEIAAGPVGWLYAGTSIVAAGLSGYSMYEALTGAS